MIEDGVDVGSESFRGDWGGARKGRERHVRRNEAARSRRRQFANRHTVPCHYERIPTVQRSHDVAARVTEFPLGDLPRHDTIVARVLRIGGDSFWWRIQRQERRHGRTGGGFLKAIWDRVVLVGASVPAVPG